MELKEFVSNTLTQIAEGVQEAINISIGSGYLVSPSLSKDGGTCKVHFDLCVTAQKEGGMNIKVVDGRMSETRMNRISFDVNMTLPHPVPPSAVAAHKRTKGHLEWTSSHGEHRSNHEE